MKIAIADNVGMKFCRDVYDHWIAQGHEVRFERGASEYLAQWADVYYVDFWEGNIHYLYNLYHGKQEIAKDLAWDNNKKPKIICRALDWEVWVGQVRDQAIIDWVDEIIFIAPHIQKRVASEVNLKGKGKLIRPGVNLNKFTLKKETGYGWNIGMVLGDMWWPKNHMEGLGIFKNLYDRDNRWRLHIRGQHEPGEYWPIMYEHYLESRGIKDVVTLYSPQEDMNEWYEKINILLHPGMKEAFCYAVGESMAKGIPAVVNNFYGSDNIWEGKAIVYNTTLEAEHMIEATAPEYKIGGVWTKHDYVDSRSFWRGKIEEYYPLERMLKEYDELL